MIVSHVRITIAHVSITIAHVSITIALCRHYHRAVSALPSRCVGITIAHVSITTAHGSITIAHGSFTITHVGIAITYVGITIAASLSRITTRNVHRIHGYRQVRVQATSSIAIWTWTSTEKPPTR